MLPKSKPSYAGKPQVSINRRITNTGESTGAVLAASELHLVSQTLPFPPETEHTGWAMHDSRGSLNRILAWVLRPTGTQFPLALFPLYLIDKEEHGG